MAEHPDPWTARPAGPLDPGLWLVHDANGNSIAVQSSDLHMALEKDIAHLVAAAPAMRDALEAEEATFQHYMKCILCDQRLGKVMCREGHDLWHSARKLRQAALAQARGEAEARTEH